MKRALLAYLGLAIAATSLFASGRVAASAFLQWGNPAVLTGILRMDTYTTIRQGKEVRSSYRLIKLDTKINIAEQDKEFEPQMLDVAAVQLPTTEQTRQLKVNQRITVECKALWHGNTSGYALPVFCAEPRLLAGPILEMFAVPIGAFSNPDAVFAKLEAAGLLSTYYTEQGRTNTEQVRKLTRVYSGPWPTKASAEWARQQLRELGLVPGQVITLGPTEIARIEEQLAQRYAAKKAKAEEQRMRCSDNLLFGVDGPDAAIRDAYAGKPPAYVPDLSRPVYLVPGSLVCVRIDMLTTAQLDAGTRKHLISTEKCIITEKRVQVSAATYSIRQYAEAAASGSARVVVRGAMSDARVYSAWTCIGNLRN